MIMMKAMTMTKDEENDDDEATDDAADKLSTDDDNDKDSSLLLTVIARIKFLQCGLKGVTIRHSAAFPFVP